MVSPKEIHGIEDGGAMCLVLRSRIME